MSVQVMPKILEEVEEWDGITLILPPANLMNDIYNNKPNASEIIKFYASQPYHMAHAHPTGNKKPSKEAAKEAQSALVRETVRRLLQPQPPVTETLNSTTKMNSSNTYEKISAAAPSQAPLLSPNKPVTTPRAPKTTAPSSSPSATEQKLKSSASAHHHSNARIAGELNDPTKNPQVPQAVKNLANRQAARANSSIPLAPAAPSCIPDPATAATLPTADDEAPSVNFTELFSSLDRILESVTEQANLQHDDITWALGQLRQTNAGHPSVGGEGHAQKVRGGADAEGEGQDGGPVQMSKVKKRNRGKKGKAKK